MKHRFLVFSSLSLIVSSSAFAGPNSQFTGDLIRAVSDDSSKKNIHGVSDPIPYQRTFNSLVQREKTPLAPIITEISRLERLSRQRVLDHYGPARKAPKPQGLIGTDGLMRVPPTPSPGEPIYRERGLSPSDLVQIKKLIKSALNEQNLQPDIREKLTALARLEDMDQKKPWLMGSKPDAYQFLRKATKAIGAPVTIKVGTGESPMSFVITGDKVQFLNKQGQLQKTAALSDVEAAVQRITKASTTSKVMGKIKSAGGNLANVAASSVLAALIGESMVGEENAPVLAPVAKSKAVQGAR